MPKYYTNNDTTCINLLSQVNYQMLLKVQHYTRIATILLEG